MATEQMQPYPPPPEASTRQAASTQTGRHPPGLALQESPPQQLLSIPGSRPYLPSELLGQAASSRGDGMGWPLLLSSGVTRPGPHH